jgi:hypothetical protein
MYLTQSSFHGKTGHPYPNRIIRPEELPDSEKTYPNRWMEDRNLRSLHTRVGSTQAPTVASRARRENSAHVSRGPQPFGGNSGLLNV